MLCSVDHLSISTERANRTLSLESDSSANMYETNR